MLKLAAKHLTCMFGNRYIIKIENANVEYVKEITTRPKSRRPPIGLRSEKIPIPEFGLDGP